MESELEQLDGCGASVPSSDTPVDMEHPQVPTATTGRYGRTFRLLLVDADAKKRGTKEGKEGGKKEINDRGKREKSKEGRNRR